MSDQDLLYIIETLKILQIQQHQIIQQQRDLTEQLAGRGGGTAKPHRSGSISPDTTATVNPIVATPHHLSHPTEFHRPSSTAQQVTSYRGDTTSPVTSDRVSPTIIHSSTSNIISSAGPSTHPHTFVLGEQVYITNRITHSVTPGPLDWAAIVTQVGSRQIDFCTLSGHETWHSPGNLRHLTEQEMTSLNHLLNSGS